MNIQTSLTSDNCYHIQLDRSKRGNSLNGDCLDRLATIANEIKNQHNISCITIKANGHNFCTGLDLHWLQDYSQHPIDKLTKKLAKLEYFLSTLNALPIVKLGVVQGKSMGAGIGILACCDLVIAAENAVFKLPELSIGILPAIILPYLAQAIGSRKATHYALSGSSWTASQALSDGLIQQITKLTELESAENDLIRSILSNPANSLNQFMSLSQTKCTSAASLAISIKNSSILKNKLL